MKKISYAACFGLSLAILAQFALEMRVAARNREKFTKTPYFWGSRSFKVIDVDIDTKLVAMLAMISSTSVPICNYFHVRRDNSSKITPLMVVPLFRQIVCEDPFYLAA